MFMQLAVLTANTASKVLNQSYFPSLPIVALRTMPGSEDNYRQQSTASSL